MSKELHPDYTRAPTIRRWRGGSLRSLTRALFTELEHEPAGTWTYRVLPGGAHVGARMGEEGKELRFYRRDPPATTDGYARWGKEVLVFRASMALDDWDEIPSPATTGPCVTLREPMALGL